ncbi:hypothetical protein [Paenibacillus xylanexedens]|uniref:hypothetical protein n=1 Tax=Paenibacillus xylanexedens TaxID=528191 RepID=UPI001642AE4C|nr:hypothetical protein [Paenibacillus xylanexedens]
MAKLSVVIPAVDVMVGVDGKAVAYRKVDRKAQAGDIVKALRNEADIDMSAFYAVYADRDGDLVFADNVGDERPYQLRNNSTMYEVYAPISEPTAVTPTDTITFQGATWRKVDRDVRAGDAIKFTDEDRSHYLTGAELYVVDYVDRVGDPRITDDGEDGYDAGGEDYEVYEKVTDSAAQEYREVNRKAAVGERIKVIAIHAQSRKNGSVFVGEEFTVKTVDSAGDIWSVDEREFSGLISPDFEGVREYVVLESVTKAAESAQPERLKVGDYARVVEDQRTSDRDPISSRASVGDIVEVLEDDGSGVPFRVRIVSGANVKYDSAWARPFALVRATDEEVAAAKRAALIAQFSVGDYVKLTPPNGAYPRYGRGSVANGDIGKVTEVLTESIYVDFPAQSGWRADLSELTKLTAEEVAEIERESAKQAEEKSWAAIGRKVNEYKRGDIVKFIRSDRYNALTPGDVGEVVEKDFDGDLRVNTQEITDGNWCKPAQISLIVPVEQRFDRPSAENAAEEVDAA